MLKTEAVTDAELAKHDCLECVDRVAGDPATTAFKRRARLRQSLWREARKLDAGTQPVRAKPGQKCRALGSRLALDVARKSESNFISDAAREAVRHRIANPERHQTLDANRLYGNLLSSMPMCFNLFGPLFRDLDLATAAVKTWWPDAPGSVCAVRFEWSPGRRIPGRFLENRSAFDVAFELNLDDGTRGVVGVETKYHEHCVRENIPGPKQMRRYEHVTRESGIFVAGALSSLPGTPLQQIWLDHLLALSMLQDHSRRWTWAKFVRVHPAQNPSYARAAGDYRSFLDDSSTLEVRTIESLLETGAIPPDSAQAFAERYLW